MRTFVIAVSLVALVALAAKPKKLSAAVEASLKQLVTDTNAATYSASMKGGSFVLHFRQKLERPKPCNVKVTLSSEAWNWEIEVPLERISLAQLKPANSVPSELVGNLDWSAGSPWCSNLVFEDKITAKRWMVGTSPKDAEDYGLFYVHLCFPTEEGAKKTSATLDAAARACGAPEN